MKISKMILFTAAAAMGFLSCKKEDGVKPMTGFWEGAWGFGYEAPAYYEKWELKKAGDLISFFPDGEVYAQGFWEMDGEYFEAQYSPLGETYTYYFKGNYDPDADEITGTWRESEDPNNGGSFEMERQ